MAAYGYAESETEQSTTSTTLVDACILTFTADAADYIITAVCELGNSGTGYTTAEFLIDGTSYGSCNKKIGSISDRQNIGWIKKATLSAGSHTIKIQYKTSSNTAYIRNIHIFAWKPQSTMQYAETETEQSITTTEVDLVTLTFTPASAQNYLILASAEGRISAFTRSLQLRLKVDGVEKNLVLIRDRDTTNDYRAVALAKIENLTASPHTIKITGQSTFSTVYARKRRLVAIPLGSETVYQSSDETETSTASSTYVDKLSYSPTISTAGDHIIISSSENNINDSAKTRYNNLVIDSTQYQESAEIPTDVSDYINTYGVKKLNLSAGSHTAKIQHKVDTATVYTKMARLIIIQLTSSAATTYKTLTCTIVSAASIPRKTSKFLSIAESSVLTLRRKVSKFIKITEVSQLTLRRKASKILSISESSIAVLSRARRYVKALICTEISVASMLAKKLILKTLSAVESSVVTLRRKISKPLKITEVSQLTLRRKISKNLKLQEVSIPSIRRRVSKRLSIAAQGIVNLRRKVSKSLKAVESSATVLKAKQLIIKTLSATATSVATISRAKKIVKTLSVAVIASPILTSRYIQSALEFVRLELKNLKALLLSLVNKEVLDVSQKNQEALALELKNLPGLELKLYNYHALDLTLINIGE